MSKRVFHLVRALLCLACLIFADSMAIAQTPPGYWPVISPGKTTGFIVGKHGTDDAGHRWAAWYYLSDDGFRWIPTWQVLRRDKVLASVPEIPGEAPADYLLRLWRANTPLPCSDTAIKSICDTAQAELARQPLPEPPAFVVAKNGSTPTRPVRSYYPATRTLGALMTKRAPVGVECACWASGVRTGGSAWCAWTSPAGDTRGDEVTLCVRP